MAEFEDVCGVDGVPQDALNRLNTGSTTWRGLVFTRPTEASRALTPTTYNAEAIRAPNSKLLSGYVWREGDATMVGIRGLGVHTFPSYDDAIRWVREAAGMERVSSGVQLKVKGTDRVLAFDVPNAFSRAGDVRKAIAMAVCRVCGNTSEATDFLRAIEASATDNNFGRITEWLRQKSGNLNDDALYLSNIDAENLNNTLAGRFLNSADWANAGLFNAASVLEREAVSGYAADQLRAERSLSISDNYLLKDAQRHAGNIGKGAPLSDMLDEVRRFGKAHGIRPNDLMQYRMAMFHPERVAQITRRKEEEIIQLRDKDTQKQMDAYVRQKEAEAKERGEMFTGNDKALARQEYRETQQEGDLSDNYHRYARPNLEFGFRDKDPLAFTHRLDDGTVLHGQEAVDRYLSGLSPERARALAAGNAALSHGLETVHNLALKEGILTDAQVESFSRNYTPQRSDEHIKRIIEPYGPVGRFEAIKDPWRSFTNYIDTVTRISNENMVRRAIADDLRTFSESPIWTLEDVNPSEIRAQNEGDGYIISYPPGENDTTVKRQRLVIHPDALKTRDGKDLQKLLEVKRPTAVMRMLASYTKFSSIMYTTARPAWALKSLAMNTFVTPVALESALGVDGRTAANLLFKNEDGRNSFLTNVYHDFLHRVKEGVASTRGKEIHGTAEDSLVAAYHDMAARYGASSAEDNRFSTRNLMTESRRAHGSIVDRLRAADADRVPDRLDGRQQGIFRRGLRHVRAGASVLADDAKSYATKYQAINHTPDEIFKTGAFRTFVEYKAQQKGAHIRSVDDLNRFARLYPSEVDAAAIAATRIMPQFNRKGNIRFLNTVFPFFNASLQTLPFMSQLACSRSGQIGLGGMMILGYMGAQIARNEYGDAGENMKGGDNSVYLGHGLSVPTDYVYAPFLTMGQALEHGFNSQNFRPAKETANVFEAFLKSFSPFDVPWEGQSTGVWAATHIAPPGITAPFLTMVRLDENGNPYYNDNPTDVNGRALANPAGYQSGKISDSLISTQISKMLDSISGHLVDVAPGFVTGAFRIAAPGVEDTITNLIGEREGKYGDDDSILGRLRDVFAPSFRSAPTYTGGRNMFEDRLHELIPPGGPSLQDLQSGLAGTPEQQQVARLHKQAQQVIKTLRVPTPDGQLAIADVKHRLEQAKRDGDAGRVNAFRLSLTTANYLSDQVWRDFNGRIEQ